ncbi:hypothetical protein ACFVZD_37320 [Streptomyces sp. NPDC058287]|uniref:hypothetical protein n=1 Tax=Streptomyces sp. NPDC058287 TaxID=3346423 RepID=UPI0036E4C72E
MTRPVHELDRYEDIRAALANPDLVPELPASADGPVGASMAWLRATVSRFSSGQAHTRRRALVEAELARLDPTQLRQAAAPQPRATVDEVRIQVVLSLAEALRLSKPDIVAKAITAVADVYFGGVDPVADAAVAQLVDLLSARSRGENELEAAAARICLLVQACDATAALVRHTRAAATTTGVGTQPIEVQLAETLRRDPPVRTLRRIAVCDTRIGGRDIAEGDLVLLDTTASVAGNVAEPLAFGAPPRICPGREQALALASGILMQ